ncbi:D-inositol-3-phosphate glycosyltransferase [subsurface metagenome]
MKILMLNHEYPPIGGGGGYAGRNILRQFAGRSDIELDVVVSRPRPPTIIERLADNITLYRVGVRKKAMQFWTRPEMIQWMAKAYRIHKKLLQQNQYDLAHAFFGFPTAALTWRTVSKLPYIISLRGSDVPGVNVRFSLDYKLLAPVFRRIWENASALYACSEGLRQRALKFMPEAKIYVVPNGVELDRFCPVNNKQKIKDLKLLTVGRLSVSKRIELLVSVVELIRKQFPNATLKIAGGGGLENQLRKLIKDKGMENCIAMLGIVPAEEMPELYRKSDIFVSASLQEGMSNAMLEAMASGLPIITTRCEGVQELIADNGIVVEQPEPESIAGAIKQVANDQNRYEQMSIAARRQAEKFSWESVASQYLDCYHKVLNYEAEN